MPPNTIEGTPYEPKVAHLPVEQPKPSTEQENYGLHICQATLNMIGRLCVGIVVGINLAFAFRFGVPLSTMNQHIVLCVIGVSIFLSFNSKNSWPNKRVTFSAKSVTK